jgi:ABC-type sugar transport system ATPase subunit
MRDGVIEQIASPHTIFAKPGNVFVAGFIGTPQMNLVSATLADVVDGEALLAFADQRIKIPVDRAVAALPKGSKVTFGVRPRAFTLAGAASERAISGAAEIIEPMGAETLIHMRTGLLDMRVVVPRQIRVRPGHVLHLTCDPSQVNIFDDAGKAVRS